MVLTVGWVNKQVDGISSLFIRQGHFWPLKAPAAFVRVVFWPDPSLKSDDLKDWPSRKTALGKKELNYFWPFFHYTIVVASKQKQLPILIDKSARQMEHNFD